jgi:membrane associated rhomboid family serine protease
MKGPHSGRPPTPSWLRPITERLSPTIRALVIVMSVLFGLYIMVGPLRPQITNYLALGPFVGKGAIWQPATSLFVHLDPLGYFFDMLGLWFVGATLERSLGRRRFLFLFFGAGLLANLIIGVFLFVFRTPALFAGCGDAVLALFVAFGVQYGRTQVRVFGALAMEARWLAGILVGMSILSPLLQGAWLALLGTLVAVAFAYFVSGGRIDDIKAALRRDRRTRIQILDGGKRGRSWMN